MIDTRKQKIRDLKKQIKTKQDALVDVLAQTPKETKTEQQIKIETEILKAEIQDLKKGLNLTRMNKNSSSFFEFIPTLANRRMRRAYRKLRKA